MTAIATDLDGTLLDADATLGRVARDALAALRRAGVPVALMTTKTESELRRWLGDTGAEFGSFENGAGIVGPGGVEIDPRALSIEALMTRLAQLGKNRGAPLIPIRDLPDEALREMTGLSGDAAMRARQRQYDIPFLAPGRTPSQLRQVLAGIPDVALERGGVFWHLSGRHDKGTALDRILARYRLPPPLVGLGDAEIDAPFLMRCDQVVLVPGASGVRAELREVFPRAYVARHPGGEGWAEAVKRLTGGDRGETGTPS
ncbi:MAG TPA: HAD hydrolase family protein [Thermoanaerobaculia bacterium]|nr:HAD hydrolase family protein [Thermoanaerobaculia bacterium]